MATAFYMGLALGLMPTGSVRWTDEGVTWTLTGIGAAYLAGLLYGICGWFTFFLATLLGEDFREGAHVPSSLPFWLGCIGGLAVGVVTHVGERLASASPAGLLFLGMVIAGFIGGAAWSLMVKRVVPTQEDALPEDAAHVVVRPKPRLRLRGARAALRSPEPTDSMLRVGAPFAITFAVLVTVVLAIQAEQGGLVMALIPALLFGVVVRRAAAGKTMFRDLSRFGPEITGVAAALVPAGLVGADLLLPDSESSFGIATLISLFAVPVGGAWLWVRAATMPPR